MSYARAIKVRSGSYRAMQRPRGMVIPGLRLSGPWHPNRRSLGPCGREVIGLTDATSNSRVLVCARTTATALTTSKKHFRAFITPSLKHEEVRRKSAPTLARATHAHKTD